MAALILAVYTPVGPALYALACREDHDRSRAEQGRPGFGWGSQKNGAHPKAAPKEITT